MCAHEKDGDWHHVLDVSSASVILHYFFEIESLTEPEDLHLAKMPGHRVSQSAYLCPSSDGITVT